MLLPKFIIVALFGNMLLEKVNISFFKASASNATNFATDIFIIPTTNIHKKITPGHEKVLT